MGEYHSLSAIDEAVTRTMTLLWPPSRSVWIRILLITLFIGGGMMNPIQGDFSLRDGTTFMDLVHSPALPVDLLLTIAFVLFLILGIYSLVSSVFQFVFVDCLSLNEIRLYRPFLSRFGSGIRLFGFYLLLIGGIIAGVLIVMILVTLPLARSGDQSLQSLLTAIVLSLIALFLILIPVWIVAILTTDFVVPVMITDRVGVLQGWMRLFSVFHGRWTDLFIFVGIKILISISAGVILGVLLFLIGLIFKVPDLVFSVDAGFSSLTATDQFLPICIFGIISLLISLTVTAPVITFLRYYSLIMIGRVNPEYRLITDKA